MTEKPSLDANSLDSYIKCKEYDDDKYEIIIYLSSSDTGFAFVVGMRVKESHTEGAFPQKRITMEQHDGDGHDGVHVQIHYHAIDNAMKIGRIYVTLDIDDDTDLLNTAEGFVYTLYEIFLASGPEFTAISEQIFNVPHLAEIQDKKIILTTKMKASLAHNMIQIKDQAKGEVRNIMPKDFAALLQTREELVPLLGGVVAD